MCLCTLTARKLVATLELLHRDDKQVSKKNNFEQSQRANETEIFDLQITRGLFLNMFCLHNII